MMKQEIYKKSFEKYESILYKDTLPVNLNSLTKEDDFMVTNYSPPTEKHPLFIFDKTFTDEKTYIENYSNPMYSVMKHYVMVVVEKYEDKVSLKVFRGYKNRRAGKSWFKVCKNVDYVSVNIKTGDVYFGFIHDFQKKRCTKRIRRNVFLNDPLNNLKCILKNNISQFSDDSYNEVMNAFSSFMFEIDQRINFEELNFSQRLFRFYLNKRGIKYPNNFGVYADILVGPEIRKLLKKNDNKLVDSFMIKHQLSGKKIKKALHTCTKLNIELYQVARKLFGDDWLNQDEENVIVDILDSVVGTMNIPDLFIEIISKEELKKVYRLFKQVYIHQDLDMFTFLDHIRMYTELKMCGENELKWTSFEDKTEFRKEHLDWTDKLQHYKQGTYTRHYPEYMYEKISEPIFHDYYPILLNKSSSYNEESNTQSNCVKGYIGKPNSLIISLRKGGKDSEERATVEYKLTKVDDVIYILRVQSLGKFNGKLDGTWELVLLNLDLSVLSCVRDPRFEPVKLTKECTNGTILESDSYWDEGKLRWEHKHIESNNLFTFPMDLL